MAATTSVSWGDALRTATGRLGVLFSAILILLTCLAPACSDKGPSVDADEIVAKAAAAQSSLETYRMDSHVSGKMLRDSSASKTSFIGFLDVSAAVDGAHRRMQLDMTMGMGESADSGGLKYYAQAFLIDNHLYTGISMTRDAFQWSRGDLAGDYWASAEMMQQQVALLQSAGRQLTGEESIDGIDCYVFDLTPDVAQTVAMWNLESFLGQGATVPDLREEWVQSATVRQWIAKDTSRLTKSEVQVTLRLAAAELDATLGEGDLEITLAGEAFFHHYNEWVSTAVPPAAIQ
jgi:hypothetical protein